jgi:flagellar biosynthesis protein FliR
MSIPIAYPYLFLLLFLRFLAFFVTAPLFSQRTIPLLVKIGLALLLAFLLAPLSPAVEIPSNDLIFLTLVVQEIMVGLLLGVVVFLPILTIGMIGQLIASAMGLMMGSSISPLLNEPTTTMGQFYLQLAVLIFVVLGLDRVVLLGLKQLVIVLPPGRFLSDVMLNAGDLLVERILYFTTQMWIISLQLSLPTVGAILLADLALVLIGRAMPRMNAFALSLPLKVLMGLLIVLFSFPYLWPQVLREVDKSGQQILLLFR